MSSINMEKAAGILDKAKDRLAPDLFNEYNKLHSDIRLELLENISKKIPLDQVPMIIMGGSLTGLRYNDTSDVDVTIYLNNPPENWTGSAKSELVGDISHKHFRSPLSARTYQYYVVPWTKHTRRGLYERDFGVYDLKADEWLREPITTKPPETVEQKYFGELIVARRMLKEFNKIISRFKEAFRQYKYYESNRITNANYSTQISEHLKRKAQQAWKDAVDMAYTAYIKRHHRYSLDWGIPRLTGANVNYKILSYSNYGDEFDVASNFELPPRVEDIDLNLVDSKLKLKKLDDNP